MKRINLNMCMAAVFILCLTPLCLTACRVENEPATEEIILVDKHLQGISEENISYLFVISRNEETEKEKSIEVNIDERWMVINESDLFEKEPEEEKITLTEDQCQELRKLILDYSYQVHDKEHDYWPDTEEYPPMLVLFEYKVCYGEESYSDDGALCYPDGWEEFIKTLESYAQPSDGVAENETEGLAFEAALTM